MLCVKKKNKIVDNKKIKEERSGLKKNPAEIIYMSKYFFINLLVLAVT